jgi:hypothetical protein
MERTKYLAPLAVALLGLAACGLGATSTAGSGANKAVATQGKPSSLYAQSGPTQASQAAPPPGADIVPVAEGPRVIRTASLTVQVGSRGFDASLSDIFDISTRYGGYVSGSSSAQVESGALRSGTVTFMVPADKFQDALASVRTLGTVQQFNIGGQDVSAQYVDLQARLKNAQAQQAAFQALLQKATSIQDIIAIQNQLGQVTAQIEQLEGQIAYLDHATSYSSISVMLREAAAPPAPADAWGFQTAVSDALHGFVNTIDWLILGLGNALPVILIVALLAAAWWRWLRRPAARAV